MENNLEDILFFSHKDYLCTVIHRISHLCEIKQNAIVKDYGLVHQQLQVLAFIYARQDSQVFQKDIEQALFLKSSTITQALNTLEKKGFIERIPCERDRRAKQLRCTKKSADLHEVFLESVFRVGEEVTRDFDEKEKEELDRLLRKAYKNLEV